MITVSNETDTGNITEDPGPSLTVPSAQTGHLSNLQKSLTGIGR